MERQLKHHEQKLLRRTNFSHWKGERVDELKVLRRYYVTKREDYLKYQKICMMMKKLAFKLSQMSSMDPYRIAMTDQLLEKAYSTGIVPVKKNLSQISNITASAFCRRRLPVILVKNRYCENLTEATKFVEHGHIRVGPDVITDPSYHVTRNMEDFISWVDTSKIKKKILSYHDKLDDYDFLE
eukprot:TRINITY_DN795_c0_g1_i1.p1 TRINITY_DN795_c0_g1~~TRINITY_DN795_c0_g1_i1.p1  ORF type:complete len:183 (-),score=15.52 TRINITY_DN795_c0_g1_i1:44-592(-)